MKLVTKLIALGCGFLAISGLATTFACAVSEAKKKVDGYYNGNKEYDLNNSDFSAEQDTTWF